MSQPGFEPLTLDKMKKMKKTFAFCGIRTHSDSSDSGSLTTYPLGHRDLIIKARSLKVYKLPLLTCLLGKRLDSARKSAKNRSKSEFPWRFSVNSNSQTCSWTWRLTLCWPNVRKATGKKS